MIILVVLAAALVIAYKLSVKPPDPPKPPSPPDTTDTTDTTNDTNDPPVDSRSGKCYTFLVLGSDDGNGNTDVNMVATFDTAKYTFNVVSIPRDTMVNVKWLPKKVNSLYGVGGVARRVTGVYIGVNGRAQPL